MNLSVGTITCPVARYARENSGLIAVVGEAADFTYKDLHTAAMGWQEILVGQGIVKDSRVGLIGRNSIEMIGLLIALWRLGAVAVPINFRFPAITIQELARRLDIRLFFVDPAHISLCSQEMERDIIVIEHSDKIKADPANEWDVAIDLSGDATIVSTSGSTGDSKAVLLTYGNQYYSALGSNENIDLGPGDRWLLSLPLFHVGGLGILFRCFLAGAAVVVPDNCQLLEQATARFSITHMSLVSTQLHRFLIGLKTGSPGGSNRVKSRLKGILLGGSGFPPPLIREALEEKLPVFTTYGLSEMASQVATTSPGATERELLTSGRLLKYREMRIQKNGEICVKGFTCFKGYVKENALIRPLDQDGWFHTGDLGHVDENGHLSVWGRLDNMFISGGENIMPEEIEKALTRIPGIRRAMVVPLEEKEYGFRPAAFIEIEKNATIVRDRVMEILETRLPRFKIPDVFFPWPKDAETLDVKLKRSFFRHLLAVPGLTPLFRKY